MFTLHPNPLNGALSVRPVCKATDRLVVRELFRKEFFGDLPQPYLDDGLWEIYDSMETNALDPFGAYLVSYYDRALLLLEIHPPVQMDLPAATFSRSGTIGVYCFFISPLAPMNGFALRACIGSLLDYPGVHCILTTAGDPAESNKTALLKKCGFQRLPKNPGKAAVYCCTAHSFPLLPDGAGHLAATGA